MSLRTAGKRPAMLWNQWASRKVDYLSKAQGGSASILNKLATGTDTFVPQAVLQGYPVAERKGFISACNSYWATNETPMRGFFTAWVQYLTGFPAMSINAGGIYRAFWWAKFFGEPMLTLAPAFGTPPIPSRENGYEPVMLTPIPRSDPNESAGYTSALHLEAINRTATLSFPQFTGYQSITEDYEFDAWIAAAYPAYLSWAGEWENICQAMIPNGEPWRINGGPWREPYPLHGVFILFEDDATPLHRYDRPTQGPRPWGE